MKTLIAGVLALVIAFLVLAFAGCAATFRPATGSGKATATVNVLITVGLDGREVIRRRLVTVNNPTDEGVILDCHAFRWRVPAGMASNVLLMPHDTGCDLQPDVAYSPNTEVPSIPIPDVPVGVTVKK